MVMQLTSPSHAVVGSTDLDRSARFLAVFGFEITASAKLPTAEAMALYGLDQPVREARLAVPGTARGWIRLVETPHPPRATTRPDHSPYDHRPVALDLYTRDIEQSIAMARATGAEIGKLVDYAVGPLALKEVETLGPDGLVTVFIEIANRRPSILDTDRARIHSEVHSIVFAVPSAERALATWRDAAGLDVLVDAPIRGPVISELMSLPRDNVPVRFVLLSDEEASPARFELIEFVEDPGQPHPTRPLAAGLHAAGFAVQDLDRSCAVLEGCHFESMVSIDSAVHPNARAVAGTTEDGLPFELWHETP